MKVCVYNSFILYAARAIVVSYWAALMSETNFPFV